MEREAVSSLLYSFILPGYYPLQYVHHAIILNSCRPRFRLSSLTIYCWRKTAIRPSRSLGARVIVVLLFTDIVMPGISGIKPANILMSKQSAIKVLPTSGCVEEIVRKKDLIKPGVEYMEKLIVSSLLIQKFRCCSIAGKDNL